jgi:hypothetical protein
MEMTTKRRRKDVRRPLPTRTAELAAGGDGALTSPEAIRGLICNPIYTGLGPFPRMVPDETWIKGAAKLIREEGPEQFLVNMLHVLRRSFKVLDSHDP